MLRTPVVFFVYNRPELARLTLETIVGAEPPRIYFVQDGAPDGSQRDAHLVRRVRRLLDNIPESIEVIPMISMRNLGIRDRFLSALDEVFESEARAIIIEDDCLVEPSFFGFAERCLDRYQYVNQVMTVTGHRPVTTVRRRAVFDEVTRIWGWATWADRWKSFRTQSQSNESDILERGDILRRIRSRTWRLMASQLFTPALRSQNWDIALSTYALNNRLLNVAPPHNAVRNLGSLNGTHEQPWAHLEIPRPRPIQSSLVLPDPKARATWEVLIEDLTRLIRWLLAFSGSPLMGVRKVIHLTGWSRRASRNSADH